MPAVTIPGEPIAKGRPRFGNGRTYTPKATLEAEEHVGWLMKATGAQVDASSRFHVGIVVKSKKAKADLDNILKLILDAGNGVIWNDDSQVVSFTAFRSFDLCACGPQTVVSWWTL